MEKPFYKKWWFWLVIVVVLIALVVSGNDEEKETKEDDKSDNETEEVDAEESEAVAKQEAKEKKEEAEAKKKEKKTNNFDDFSTAEYSVENIEAEIKDDTLYFSFRWINQSGEDIHFTALGYIDVSQDEEQLEETSGAYEPDNRKEILFKNANGGAHRVDLEYELENEEDIRIVFGTTLEGSDSKEELIIDID